MAGVFGTGLALDADEAFEFAGGGEADEVEGFFEVLLLAFAFGVF